MPKFAANLTMMFNEVPFLDRFARAAGGFEAVEFLFPYEAPPEAVAARLKDNNLTVALFNLPPGIGPRASAASLRCRGGRRNSVRASKPPGPMPWQRVSAGCT